MLLHKAGALAGEQIVAGDGTQRRLPFPDLDGQTGLHAAVAVAVRHHQGAAAFDKLGKVRVVVLAAGQQDLAAVLGSGVRLTGLQLLQRLAELVDDQVLGTGQGHQVDDMVLIAGDGGHVQLAVIADSLHNTAELVVALDGLAQGLVRGVHAVIVMEEIQDVGLDLCLVMVNTVFRLFERDIHELALEALILDDIHTLEVLLKTAGHGAGLGSQLGIQEIEAALQGTLKKAAAVVTGAGRHIIGRHIRGCAAGGAQAHREAAGQVQQHLRHEIAGVA